MAAYSDDTSLRIVVSGIKKGSVRRYGRGIIEEDDLGWFFHDHGCKVVGVRLVIDTKRGDSSRGFGFVDFGDYESLQIALKLHNTEVRDLAGKDGRLKIEQARAATDEGKKKQQELADARNKTEEMERELAFHEARLNELVREVKRKRERQNMAQAHEQQLQEETRRQAAIRQAMETIKDAEQRIHGAIEVEENRLRDIEAIVFSVDDEQVEETRRHQDEEKSVCDPDASTGTSAFFPQEEPGNVENPGAVNTAVFEPPAREELHPDVPKSTADDPGTGDAIDEDDLLLSAEQAEVRVRHTFIEYWVPETLSLRRTRTAPPLISHAGPASGASTPMANSPPAGEQQSAVTTDSPQAAKTDDGTAPWVLRRELSDRRGDSFSAADVSRAILEEKMGGPSSTESTVATGELEPKTGSPNAGDVAQAAPRAPVSRRAVRLRNVPLLPQEELMALLTEELARLWKAVRGKAPPVVDELRLPDRRGDRATFAQIAAGTEAEVVFADADDAAWLVDGRQPCAWSRAETLTLRGRMVEASWLEQQKLDFRRLRWAAETDASSQISYGTLGTKQSFSSNIAARVATRPPVQSQASAAPKSPMSGAGADGPARNRTVLLEGFPKNWPAHQVRDEVLSLLKRLWQRDGLTFDPQRQLHHGGDGGVEVRAGRRAGEETTGTCLVRLRVHMDARWLVDGAGGRLTVGGHRLSSAWARPRPERR